MFFLVNMQFFTLSFMLRQATASAVGLLVIVTKIGMIIPYYMG